MVVKNIISSIINVISTGGVSLITKNKVSKDKMYLTKDIVKDVLNKKLTERKEYEAILNNPVNFNNQILLCTEIIVGLNGIIEALQWVYENWEENRKEIFAELD